MVPNSSLNMIN